MNEWLNKFKQWWNNLAPREQQVVSVGSIVVAVILFYVIIWGPYLARIDAMRKHIQSEKQNLAWMEAADSKIKKLSGQTQNHTSSLTPVVLLGILQKQIKEAGLDSSLTGMKQNSTDAVEMHFQKVAFDKLMALVESVLKEQNVTVTQLSAVSVSTPGAANVDVIFKLK